MLGEIQMAIASLKAASDLAKGLIELRDESKFRETVLELQQAILTAQAQTLTANQQQATLIEDKRSLEAEIDRLKNWDEEKKDYELKQIVAGVFAYELKPDATGTEPPHRLCPNCYTAGKKSILQSQLISPGLSQTLHCHACGQRLFLSGLAR